MTIMAVDNFTPRLAQLHELLGEIYPDDEIAAFSDPFFAVKYSMNHGVDIAFVQEKMRPFSHANLSRLVRKFNENANVYLIVDDLGSGTGEMADGFTGCLENPVSREKIETVITPQFCRNYFQNSLQEINQNQALNHQIIPQTTGIKT